uniref:tRNA (34-2'-O)-methyltransferase regulator WDR6 n=1 Tax=Macrostomum lignano TaxID=282301 RepID=A0A1I8GX75_9PLAT
MFSDLLLGVIYSIDSNSDQSIILTASDDRSIVIWRRKNSIDPAASSESDSPRLLTYEAQCQLYGHESRVWSVRLSPSSDLFYSAGEDCALITWSTCDGQLLRKETRHIGRHIWCLAVDSSGSKLATGGNDGALICSEVSDRKQTTESCRFLLRGSIAEQPQPTLRPVEVAGLPRQQESASPLRRCSCARMSPNRRVLLCAEESTPLEQGAGAACCLIDVSNTLDGNDPCRIIWRSGQLSMPDSSDEANSIKTIGGLLNLCWISDHAFIVSAVHDKLILGLLKFDSSIESPISKGASDSSNSCPATVNTEPVSLSASGFEWINCGQLSCIGSQAVMILGDRSGRLHCLVQNLETKRWQRVHSSRQAHKSGVLHLETMSLDSADEARRSIRLLSCGKDGSLIGWRVALVTDDHKDGSVGGFIQESIVKRLFKLLDAATLTVEFSADCGGGHRCWDFLTQFDNGSSGLAGAYRLCYVKSGSLLLVTQAMRASYQIKKGLHGGTINCAVVLTTGKYLALSFY